MLRNRSRAVSSKQAFMADHTSLLSPTKNPSSPISSFLGSPRFFNGFLAKTLSDADTSVMSPTSILDTKNSSSFVNPFAYESLLSKPPTPSPETNNSTNKPEPQATGLALIDSIIQENDDGSDGNLSKPINRMVLFGSKLKVQIPAINPQSSHSPAESPKSPADFGIKTRNSQLLNPFTGSSPAKDFSRQLSLKEMELSEEYTCVISHGPNPRTTHIFDGCIVESCCGVDAKDSDHNKYREVTSFEETDVSTSPSANFLSFCHNCKDILGQGKDIYMYRGEKAFCSHECRSQEILFEGMKNQEVEDAS